jgi:hypothetical protein
MSFTTGIIPSISQYHFITINRPLLDEEDIEEDIREKYKEQIVK